MHRRALNVFVVVEELRRRHPELAAPLRGRRRRLWDVIAREGVDVRAGWIGQPARSSGFDGDYLITLQRGIAPRDAWGWALHEFGHIILGHLADHGEHVRNLSPCLPDDPREDDASLFGALLYEGPEATPDTPLVGRIIARIEARRYRARPVSDDSQLRLGLPTGVPMYRSPAGPATDHGSFNPDGGRRPRDRYKGPRLKLGDSHDSLLFDWSKDGKPLGYFHLQLGWMDIWDTMPAPKEGKREILTCGDRRAQWRDFIISTTDRRRYEFAEDEKRGRAPKELDKQIERAKRLAIASPISAAALFRARKEDA
jgi:hypothetical protein